MTSVKPFKRDEHVYLTFSLLKGIDFIYEWDRNIDIQHFCTTGLRLLHEVGRVGITEFIRKWDRPYFRGIFALQKWSKLFNLHVFSLGFYPFS